MGKTVDYVVGKIEDMEHDRCAGWDAFYKKDYENGELREEIARLKQIIRDLQRGIRGRHKK